MLALRALAPRLAVRGSVLLVLGTAALPRVQAAIAEPASRKNWSRFVLNADGTWGVAPDGVPIPKKVYVRKVITLAELDKHCSADSLWVVVDGVVYDMTLFAKELHPGGFEVLLNACGRDATEIWKKYAIHFDTDLTPLLDQMKIGELSPEDARVLAERTNARVEADGKTPTKTVQRARRRYIFSTLDVVKVAITWPALEILRLTLRCLGFVGYYFGGFRIASALSSWLPVSVPGVGKAAHLSGRPRKHQHASSSSSAGKKDARPRVAVVGGGIAGTGAAYTLQKSGFDVVIYEARAKLGGNAQVFEFDAPDGKGKVRSDVAVLFWNDDYYKNYVALLRDLHIKWEPVQVNYLLHTNFFSKDKSKYEYYCPPGTAMHKSLGADAFYAKHRKDFDRYDRMIKLARWCNNLFTWDTTESFYKHAGLWPAFNPMNFLTLRQMSRLMGISNDFYDGVLRPFQGFQFSTIYIDRLPAVALPVLDEIVSLTSTGMHSSWGVNNSEEVFSLATRGCDVRLNTRVMQVKFDSSQAQDIVVVDSSGKEERFDRLVFCVPAPHVANILGRNANFIERSLLNGVKYHDDFVRNDWNDWLQVPVHQDTSIIPNTDGKREYILKNFAFVVDQDVTQKDGVFSAEYIHQHGSWSPSAKAQGLQGLPMLMTQAQMDSKPIDSSKVVGTFSPPRGHPDLCLESLMVTQFMGLIQGRRGVYYAGNYVSGGNGHDLSFLSGIAAATAMGAAYPFPWDKGASKDWRLMLRFMGLVA